MALIGDLALLHDSAGLFIGPDEPRPDLCLVVVNNDGGGIFSTLEQASFPGSFERVFGTPHGADVGRLAAAAGLPYQRITQVTQLAGARAGSGLRVVELRTSRTEAAELRTGCSRRPPPRRRSALQRLAHGQELDLGLGHLSHRVEPATMPQPANSRARGPASSAHRSAMPNSPLP